MQLLPTQKVRLFFARFFAGAMLFVWFANSLPPLLAMTSSPVESCQMECCQGFKRHSMGASASGEMCPMMARKNASHQAMHGAEEPAEEHVAVERDEHNVVAAHPFKVPIFDTEKQSNAHDDSLSYLRIKVTEQCPRTACITGNSSSFGQRQQQSSDNCLLFYFALNLPPPSLVLVEAGTQASFNFTQRIWTGQTPSRGPPAFLT